MAETSLMHNLEESRKQLQRLREVGVRIALDDFGAANCSLTLLRDLPFDTLKLDHSLVTHIGQSSRDDALVRSIIDLCRQYEVSVIAEGVETARQSRWLMANGCEFVQGVLVSGPVTPDEVNTFASRFDWGAI
ncbi:Phytochrome-like protein cph2 [compost metagenome]